MNTSLIKTASGRTIVLQHAVSNPRPYDRIDLVAGTKGSSATIPPASSGRAGRAASTNSGGLKAQKRFEDPLWRKLKKAASKGGHGGMDYVMNWRLVECLRKGLAPDMDVYDAAAWSAPTPLSEESVAKGSAPVAFSRTSLAKHGKPEDV